MNTNENKHKEEIIRATQLWECGDITRENLEYIFPELAESEDERIRNVIRGWIYSQPASFFDNGISKEDWLAWLEKQCKKEQDVRYENLEELLAADDIYQMAMNDEMVQEAKEKAVNALSEMCIGKLLGVKKQGEQKLADKVEPKFHRGEWIVHHGTENIYKVIAIVGNQYQLKYGDNYTIQKCADVDRCARLWDITKDAKDGDVLQLGGVTAIFQKYIGNGNCRCYCSVYNGEFEISSQDGDDNSYGCVDAIPATKEQRDLLFQEIHKAGYEWNDEKKELRKLEKQGKQKPIIDGILTTINFDKMFQNCNVHKFKVGDWIISKYMHLVMQILNNNKGFYETVETDGTERNDSYDFIERNFKLWTIQDAKDSDVLAAADWVFIFRKFHINGFPKCYCHYDLTLDEFKIDTDSYMASGGDIYPATKEQRELLFSKMKEAGYVWDDEKKLFSELKNNDDEKLNGRIMLEDFNEGDGFYKVNLAYLNKKQVEEIEKLVDKWNPK